MNCNNVIKCLAKTTIIRNTFALNDMFPFKYFHIEYSSDENPRFHLKALIFTFSM